MIFFNEKNLLKFLRNKKFFMIFLISKSFCFQWRKRKEYGQNNINDIYSETLKSTSRGLLYEYINNVADSSIWISVCNNKEKNKNENKI